MQQRHNPLLEDAGEGGAIGGHSDTAGPVPHSDTALSKSPLKWKIIGLAILIAGIVALIVTLVVLTKKSGSNDDAPVVVTLSGQVQGVNEGSVSRYLGIPYAKPPTGERRWAAPEPNDNWSGVLKADQWGPVCPQLGSDLTGPAPANQGEDCLSLNVYTPKGFHANSSFPVMFWIHGGAFVIGGSGYSYYDGQSIVSDSQQVVFVSINYRLGVFGFLALEDLIAESPENSTGNYGIQDQILALTWVQDNIKAFGGDPDKVTIWGESAGCNSVLTLLTTDYTRGLFRGAICDSGGYDDVAMPLESALVQGAYVLNQTGCSQDTAVLDCLRSMEITTLLNAYGGCTGLPTIDGVVVPDYPVSTISTSTYRQVPLLMGVNLNEGTAFSTFAYGVPDSYYQPILQGYLGSLGLSPQAIDEAAVLYPLSDYQTPQGNAVFWAISDIVSDELFKCGTRRFLRAVSTNYPSLPLHVYLFGYPNTPNEMYNLTMPLGAFHGSELSWIFQTFFPIPSNSTNFAQMMQKYWTSMVINQNPTVDWPVFNYSAGEPNNIYLDVQTRTETAFVNNTKCDFWDSNPTYPGLCRVAS